MKRYNSIIVLILFIISLKINCFAVDSASIGTNDIAVADGVQTVPIYLSHNPGLMGYKISVEYPVGVHIKSISRGTLCQQGNFNTNLENHKENKIDVVWNNTENVTGDGSLFVLSLTANKEAINKELKISYNKDDTFNENWQDVALFCTSVSIVSSEDKEYVLPTNESISDRDYDYIETVIANELTNFDAESIDNIKSENIAGFVDSIKQKLPNFKIDSIDDIKTLYDDSVKNGIISTSEIILDSETVKTQMKDILKEMKKKDFNEIKNEDVEKLAELFSETVLKDENDLQNDFNILDDNSKLEVIKSVYSHSIEKESEKTSGWLWAIIPITVIVAILLALPIIKKRKGVRSNEENNINTDGSTTNSI